ncbi:MAG: hypothetical protein K2X01_01950 [Cyanobacteria bacterium]|nr:hypothetical protein [Cyanobacteriota bacterium]
MAVAIPLQQRASDYPVQNPAPANNPVPVNPISIGLSVFQRKESPNAGSGFDFSDLDAQMKQWGLPVLPASPDGGSPYHNQFAQDLFAGFSQNGTSADAPVHAEFGEDVQRTLDNDLDMSKEREIYREFERDRDFARQQRGLYSPAFLKFLRKQFRDSAFTMDDVKNIAEIYNQRNPEGIKVPTDTESIQRFGKTVFNFRQGWYSSRDWRTYQQYQPYLESQNLDMLILIQSTETRGITRPDVLAYLVSDEGKHLFNNQGEISQDVLKGALSRYNTEVLPRINAKRALEKQELLTPIELPESNEQWASLYQAFADCEPTESILNRFKGDSFSWREPAVTHTPVLIRGALKRIIQMQQGQ